MASFRNHKLGEVTLRMIVDAAGNMSQEAWAFFLGN
jgi:hypothetical protein